MFQPEVSTIATIEGEIDPDGVLGRFEDHEVTEFNAATGQPEYRVATYCRMVLPGNSRDEYFQPVRDIDKRRFPKAWDAYQRQQHQVVDGYALEAWPVIGSKARANAMKSAGVYTVEQLAAVPDNLLGDLGLGSRELREKAKLWLKDRESGAVSMKMQGELDNVKSENERLAAQVKELNAMLEQLTATEAPKGRKQPIPL